MTDVAGATVGVGGIAVAPGPEVACTSTVGIIVGVGFVEVRFVAGACVGAATVAWAASVSTEPGTTYVVDEPQATNKTRTNIEPRIFITISSDFLLSNIMQNLPKKLPVL